MPEDIIDETYKYADSCKYLSWEEFYTSYLVEVSSETVYRYSKSSLGEAYNYTVTERLINGGTNAVKYNYQKSYSHALLTAAGSEDGIITLDSAIAAATFTVTGSP